MTADAVIARLPGAGNTLPTENRVRPGAAATFELTRPRAALNTSILAASGIPAVPGLPNIGFVLP